MIQKNEMTTTTTIISQVRKRKKVLSLSMAMLFFLQLFFVPNGWSFSRAPQADPNDPISLEHMVNLFTGDLNYSIPALELPVANSTYPFKLEYTSGVQMNTPSSWVGLGWTLEAGAIQKQRNGLPDEFNGDSIQYRITKKPSVTVGITSQVGMKSWGASQVQDENMPIHFYQNSYKGYGSAVGAGQGLHQATASYIIHRLNRIQQLPGNEFESHVFLGLNDPLSYHHKATGFSAPVENVSRVWEEGHGASWLGNYGHGIIKGFYNLQRYKYDNQLVKLPSFGGQHSIDHAGELAIYDWKTQFHKDNLPFSSLQNDSYSVSGAGKSLGTFRIFNDQPRIIYDEQETSVSKGVFSGADYGALNHKSVLGGIVSGNNRSGLWNGSETLVNGFLGDQSSSPKSVFRMDGDAAFNPVKDLWTRDVALRFPIEGERQRSTLGAFLENDFGKTMSLSTTANVTPSRTTLVEAFSNQEILSADGIEMLPAYRVQYLDQTGQEHSYDRSQYPKHHPSGYTVLDETGTQYHYALPVYALKHEEMTFSAERFKNSSYAIVGKSAHNDSDPNYLFPNGEGFLQQVIYPEHAQSFLLTAVVGPDYVDVTQNGVTEDDLGYWVKFTYQKMADRAEPYKWREPFSKANYLPGKLSDPKDDKGTFTYEERELWYLAKAESKTHVITFTTINREDGFGALDRLQDTNSKGKPQQALSEMKLSKKEGDHLIPLKLLKFEYDYSLCPGMANGTSGKGKLTLRKVWEETPENSRGRLTPYEFHYHTNNPSYDPAAHDLWGNNSFSEATSVDQINSIYVNQSDKADLDRDVAAWNLTQINLPGGGQLFVDYESDDYAYVQHQEAKQMYLLASTDEADRMLDDKELKVSFILDEPIRKTLSPEDQQMVVAEHLASNDEIFFRIRINLAAAGTEEKFEYVSGKALVDRSMPIGLEKDAAGNYAHGFFYLKPVKGHHPFAIEAWEYLRRTHPEIMGLPELVDSTDNEAAQLEMIRSMAAMTGQLKEMYANFNNHCLSQGLGKQIDPVNSVVQLAVPNKIKYGGGIRVRQITLKDQWLNQEEGIYGYRYQYRIKEGGKQISSGVVLAEPFIDEEENTLSYVIDPQLVQSHAGVGYRQVDVLSLPSAALAGIALNHTILSDGSSLFPEGLAVGSSGKKVYTFYTAHEFPFLFEKTLKQEKPYYLSVPGKDGVVIQSGVTASQGYHLDINDMHGILHSISSYAQGEHGKFQPLAVASERYEYLSDTIIYEGKPVMSVQNEFETNGDYGMVLRSDEKESGNVFYERGYGTQAFLEFREYVDETRISGYEVNSDYLEIPNDTILITGFSPKVSRIESKVRMAVVSTVDFKSGILGNTVYTDQGVKQANKNIIFDRLTSHPLLSTSRNHFNSEVYSYHLPAYQPYPGMGGAYVNWNHTFEINQVYPDNNHFYWGEVLQGTPTFVGDEILLYEEGKIAAKGVVERVNGLSIRFFSESNLEKSQYDVRVIRSGKRNLLTRLAGKIESLENPIGERDPSNFYSKKILVPKE